MTQGTIAGKLVKYIQRLASDVATPQGGQLSHGVGEIVSRQISEDGARHPQAKPVDDAAA